MFVRTSYKAREGRRTGQRERLSYGAAPVAASADPWPVLQLKELSELSHLDPDGLAFILLTPSVLRC